MHLSQAVISAIIATLSLLLCHLIIKLGIESLQAAVATALMPGVIIETSLSRNNVYGFGDWRTPVLINAVTWVMFWILGYVSMRLWSLIVGKQT